MKIPMNNFFSFLFKKDIFKYWNVDITTARKIGKTKAMALMMVYWISQKPGFCGLAMRDTSSNIDDSVLAELMWALRELHVDATYSLGKRELTFINGNKIYFRGAQTQTQTQVTLAGFNSSYPVTQWIVWLEECYQFTNKQYAEIGQAIRGAPKTIFATSNPWLEDNWYVDMLNKIQPFDKNKIERDKSIIKKYYSDDMKRMIIYASIYNTPFLTDNDIAQLRNDTLAQPWMENPVIWGLPGVLSGAIYAHLMDRTAYREVYDNETIDEWTVGIDFGEVSDSTSIVLIASMNNYKDIRVVEEFEYKPTKKYSLERDEIAALVNDKIIQWREEYNIPGLIQARYDNAAPVFGNRLRKLGSDIAIKYVPCRKDLISKRIDLVTMMLAEYRIIFKDNIKVLTREMKSSMWKINKTTGKYIKEREDGNDHLLNAFEYAIERRHLKYHNQAIKDK